MSEPVIVSACRTPIGSFRGSLSSVPAARLGAVVVKEALRRAGISGESVNEVILGNVIQAGVGQAPARQASIYAGLPVSVECTTVNKVCGSGLKAVMLGAQAIQLGHADVVIAGGMESMSNAPYLLDKARSGYRLGNAQILDSMMYDGLTNIYDGNPMGASAELCARECHVSREAQDEFAIMSYTRAQESQKNGLFTKEIVDVEVVEGKETKKVLDDEEPTRTDFTRIPKLKSAFAADGSVTAANSSKINDGAAALVVMSSSKANELGVKPIAKIIAQASSAKEPVWFTTAPADGINKVLKRANMTIADIDLFEINEAFAVVALVVRNLVGIDIDKLNVNGGAVALGHPIGASGARILVTLLHAMEQRNVKRGLAAICIGGGESSAVIVERV